MNLTLNSLTALRITRAIRSKQLKLSLNRFCNLKTPDPAPAKRWTGAVITEKLAFLDVASAYTENYPLDVLVSKKEQRIRTKGVRCTCRTGEYPEDSFVDLGNGVAMSSPELMFVELARVMDPAVHLLLGMELCGRFSRSAQNPQDGNVCYDIDPITSVDRLREYATWAHWIYGAEQALETIDQIAENAWSPMEALLAALLVLPTYMFGYDLWPITLNPRKELKGAIGGTGSVQSRVPDIMFTGTNVGINYDGEDHFMLRAIAEAAVQLDRNPGSAAYEQAFEDTLAQARERIVGDKRRDRDLMALGLTVFSVTQEDLVEPGGVDRMLRQIIAAIEDEGSRALEYQRKMLDSRPLAQARQDFIWSLMPGKRSHIARERMQERENL